MNKKAFLSIILFLVFCCGLVFTVFYPSRVLGQSSEEFDNKLKESQDRVKQLENELSEIQKTASSLKQQIAYMDKQIQITGLKITDLENEIINLTNQISDLTTKIESLDVSLDQIAYLLSIRVKETYKSSKTNAVAMFLGSGSFLELDNNLRLFQRAQSHDKQLLISMQKAKTSFESQRELKQKKQEELDIAQAKLVSQKKSLDQQKLGKQALLNTTNNDEKRYQEMLAAAKAEQSAIMAAISSLVKNLKNGTPVESGTKIALMGNSGAAGGCSTAAHLHFEVTDKNGNHRNPAEFLTSSWPYKWDLAPDSPFALTGSWDWSMKNPRITQAFGMTWWAKTGFYGGKPHTGVDMVDDTDITIRTPRSGTLYKGAASCRGKPMNYVAVDHGDVISWYWHVQ